MEKEKTVQLLEQLNCKMDKIISLLENTHVEIEPLSKGGSVNSFVLLSNQDKADLTLSGKKIDN